MADRLTMVTELGLLAKDATLRGDDRAVTILTDVAGHLMEVHSDLLKLEERRRKDRQRPRRRTTDSTESSDSAESAEKGGFPPDPLSSKNLPPQHNTAREAVDGEMVERLTAQLSRAMGDLWPDADAFLKRRPAPTWVGWLREMAGSIGPGSQFVATDLAQVCRDDSALDRPIGSPKGLRIFLSSARNERLNPRPPDGRQRTTAAQRTMDNGLHALKDIA